VVLTGTVVLGAAVVPAGAAWFWRLRATPPWTFCWRLVWKVPEFWLKAIELEKELGLAAGALSNLIAGLFRVNPSSSASKSKDPD